MIANVLEEENLAVRQRADGFGRHVTDAIAGELDVLAHAAAEIVDDRLERQLRLAVLRAAEV